MPLLSVEGGSEAPAGRPDLGRMAGVLQWGGGRGDSERKRVSVSGCGRVGWQRGRQEEISF